jgi:hypothetical protein
MGLFWWWLFVSLNPSHSMHAQLNTLPVPPNPAKPLVLARRLALGLARPVWYSHLLFSGTLALLCFAGGAMIFPAESNSPFPSGELLPWKLSRLLCSALPLPRKLPAGDGLPDAAKGEFDQLLLNEPSSGDPDKGDSEAWARRLLPDCGVALRE